MITIRVRTDADLAQCEAIVRLVHERDGYPAALPDDLRGFLATPGALAAWVAVVSGHIVGHVALHPTSSPPVIDLATRALEVSAGQLGVVSRLLVSPTARGLGIGGRLLQAAADHATLVGLRPILDVHTVLDAAVRLYERNGWTRIGSVAVPFRQGEVLEHVYTRHADAAGSIDGRA
jgi:GNAT superfamily N-acetyltransferase